MGNTGKMKRALAAAGALLVLLIGTYCGSGNHRLMSIAVKPGSASVMTVSGTTQFTAVGMFSNQSTRTLTISDGLTWMSSNTAVATINGSGMAQCMMAGGPVTITASAPSGTGSTMMGTSMMIQGTAMLTCM